MFHDERNVLSEPRFGRPPCRRERTDRRAARTDAVAAAPAPAAGTAWPRATSQANTRTGILDAGVEGLPSMIGKGRRRVLLVTGGKPRRG
jgi:hypothetical protein